MVTGGNEYGRGDEGGRDVGVGTGEGMVRLVIGLAAGCDWVW